MKQRIVKILSLMLLVLSLQLGPTSAEAQCAMCKMAPESNLNMGGKAGEGLNNGILYMFATPYLVVGTIALIWWYNRRKEDEEELLEN